MVKGRKLPFYSEPVEGVVEVNARPGLICKVLKGDGTLPSLIKVPYLDGRYHITLDHPEATHWFLLTAKGDEGALVLQSTMELLSAEHVRCA